MFSFLPAEQNDRPFVSNFNVVAANGTGVKLFEPIRQVVRGGQLNMPW